MKRRFKNAAEFESAAERRGFDVEKKPAPVQKEVPVAPPSSPPPPPPQAVTVDAQVFADALERTSKDTQYSLAELARQSESKDEKFAAMMERILTIASASNHRPLRWKVAVTERDFDGRIAELDIQAHDQLNS